MKQSLKEKNELRKRVEEKLESVKEGERVHIDKEILEYLLFDIVESKDEYIEDETEDVTLKLPVWSGPFLRKIDLSEVSFDNVCWSLINDRMFRTGFASTFDELKEETIARLKQYELDKGKKVDYSYTNAQIDVSKSYEALRANCYNVVVGVDFSGLDIKVGSLSFDDCNFNSAIIEINNQDVAFYRCDLSRANLNNNKNIKFLWYDEDISIEGLEDSEEFGEGYICNDCNLSYTGINILLDKEWYGATSEEHREGGKMALADYIRKGYLDGCYINGKLIHSREERIAEGQRRLQEHNEMKESLIENVLSGIKTKKLGTK